MRNRKRSEVNQRVIGSSLYRTRCRAPFSLLSAVNQMRGKRRGREQNIQSGESEHRLWNLFRAGMGQPRRDLRCRQYYHHLLVRMRQLKEGRARGKRRLRSLLSKQVKEDMRQRLTDAVRVILVGGVVTRCLFLFADDNTLFSLRWQQLAERLPLTWATTLCFICNDSSFAIREYRSTGNRAKLGVGDCCISTGFESQFFFMHNWDPACGASRFGDISQHNTDVRQISRCGCNSQVSDWSWSGAQ